MNKRNLIIGGVILLGVLLIWLLSSGHSFTIGTANQQEAKNKLGSITGTPCENANRRPIVVMLASDPEARPLSGIGQADLVIEMPVTPSGVTRFMAVFQCQTPKEIGSIRSAREDFIPLAGGFSSLYAHWGGEHGALDHLDQHVLDNINALIYEGSTFFRKAGIKPPHNGFSNLDLIFSRAKDLGYSLDKNFVGYQHGEKLPGKNISNVATSINLDYPAPNNVAWAYDQTKNLYSRSRSGLPEVDKNTGSQVTASVVVVMHTTSHILYKGDQYIEVQTTGQGTAEIYQGGIKISGTWRKDPARMDSKLYFYGSNGDEISFMPGQIWIQISSPMS